jgi:magnesium-transporting ATPase (P-type)
MNLKKITSLVMLLATLMLTYTGVMLFIAPQGKIAYWANWEFLGLNKGEYTSLHNTYFVLFLVAFVLHVYYNFKPIKNYLSNEAKELVVATKEMIVATIFTVVFIVGTLMTVPPFTTFLSLGNDAKEYWTEVYGEPPYNHAELSSLKVFIKKTGLDETKAVQALKDSNIVFSGLDEKLVDVAKNNKKSPNDIYEIMDKN